MSSAATSPSAKQGMTLEVVALITTFLGAFAMGLVHSPRTLLLGVITIPLGSAIMFYCGFRRGRRS